MDELTLYVNQRIAQVNNNLSQQRLNFAAGGFNPDLRHDTMWCQLGYPEMLTPTDLRKAWERLPAATAAVERLLEKTWQSLPEIIESERTNDKQQTPWELLVKRMIDNAFPAIIDADRKNLINRYSALIIRYRDSRDWSEPVDTAVLRRQGEKAIVGYVTAWQEQLSPASWDEDPKSDTYGMVTSWTYNSAPLRVGADSEPSKSHTIHHSRIIVFAEGSHDGSHNNGTTALEAGYNRLIDLQKSTGGSNESVYKNSGRQLHINYDPQVDFQQIARNAGLDAKDREGLRKLLNADVEKLNKAIDAAIVTQGADVTPLVATTADPTPAWTVAANEYAACWRVPFTVIFGQQTGRLASDQDQTDINLRGTARRENFANKMLMRIVDSWAEYGIIDVKQDYFVRWKSLLDPSPTQQAETFSKIAAGNKAIFDANLQPAITIDEARGMIGLEPMGIDDLPPAATEGGNDNPPPPAAK